MHILIIEDDKIVNQNIATILRHEGMITESAHLGRDGLELLKLYDYDLILLDLMLPDLSGLDILKQIRLHNIRVPVLILSGIQITNKKVECLTAGADDYLTKPFDRNELIARIYAIIRRSQGVADSIIKIGRLTINMNTKIATIDETPIPLTAKEYALLELLALKQGTTVSKETFLNHLYGPLAEPEIKIIDVFLCKIRRKIKQLTNGEDYIKTIWGRGYILEKPE